MTKRRLVLLIALSAGMVAGRNATGLMDVGRPARQRLESGLQTKAGRGLTPTGSMKRRSQCSLCPVPWRVNLRAKSTPLVGEELHLELIGQAGPKAGRFRTAIDPKNGGLEPVAGSLSWIDDLPEGGTMTRDVTVKVVTGRPIRVTARIQRLDASGVEGFPSEQYLTLYPFNRQNGTITTEWDPQTLRPLDEPAQSTVTFSDGERGVLIKIQ